MTNLQRRCYRIFRQPFHDDSGSSVQAWVLVLGEDGSYRMERNLYHHEVHSPDGFEMGYEGSGPADLALSILADHFGVSPGPNRFEGAELSAAARRAWRWHQHLKRVWVAKYKDGFEILSEDIDQLVRLWEGGDV